MNLLAALLFSALLAIYPHMNYRPCVESHRESIIAHAVSGAEEHNVPVGIVMVVGFLETHWGCNPASGGCWGAPIDPQHRGTAGTPNQAARALATSYRVCGERYGWLGAVNRFRCGLCVCPAPRTIPIPDGGGGNCPRYWREVDVTGRDNVTITMCRQNRGYTANDAITMVERLHAYTNQPLPENLRPSHNNQRCRTNSLLCERNPL